MKSWLALSRPTIVISRWRGSFQQHSNVLCMLKLKPAFAMLVSFNKPGRWRRCNKHRSITALAALGASPGQPVLSRLQPALGLAGQLDGIAEQAIRRGQDF